MKKMMFYAAALSAALFAASTFAVAPANMVIINSTLLTTNAYVHGNPSPNVLPAYSSESIAWADVTNLCHNTMPPALRSSDPCSFEVYATSDGANPKQIDVGTVTMYLSDGHIASVQNKGLPYGLKINALAPGQFELSSFVK